MKKSKIIIPALAMIAFSVAASITGTVAWFTANRTASIEAGSYAVVKTTSNMTVTLGNGVGTTANSSTGVVTVNNKLTDGSVEHRSGLSSPKVAVPTIFTPNSEGNDYATTNGKVAVTAASTTNMKRGEDADEDDIYTAVTFDITFEIAFGASPVDIGLYLDCTADHSRFEVTGPGESPTAKTAKGFRVAFIPKGTAEATANQVSRVFADLQTSGNCKHLDGEGFTGVSYSGDLIDSGYSTALPTSGNLSAYTGRVDYLGKFAYSAKDANNKVTLVYTAVCWFEGTDPEIVNRDVAADYQTVTSYLHFEAKDLPSA